MSVLISEYHNNGFSFAPSPNIVSFQLIDPSLPSMLNVTIGDATPTFHIPSRVSFTSKTFGFDVGGLPHGVDHVRLDLVTRTVPEPTSLALLGTGLAGMLAFRRHRRFVTPVLPCLP